MPEFIMPQQRFQMATSNCALSGCLCQEPVSRKVPKQFVMKGLKHNAKDKKYFVLDGPTGIPVYVTVIDFQLKLIVRSEAWRRNENMIISMFHISVSHLICLECFIKSAYLFQKAKIHIYILH